MKQDNKVITKEDNISYSPLHVCNIVSELVLFYLCTSSSVICPIESGRGTGAIISFVTLLLGETENSLVALHTINLYHGYFSLIHLRMLYLGISFSKLMFPSLFLFALSSFYLIERRALKIDVVIGVISGAGFLGTAYTNIEGNLFRAIIKGIPVMLMGKRVINVKDDKFTKYISFALYSCAIADVLLEFNFLAGLGMFLIAHVIYILAFLEESKENAFTRGFPMFLYAFSVLFVLSPKLGDFLIPVSVYILVISIMVWRASALPFSSKWGLLMTFGSISFALSDSLIAVDKFVKPMQNIRYPILGLYWLAQILMTKGVIIRAEQILIEKKNEEKKAD